jgi:hypothetical protein
MERRQFFHTAAALSATALAPPALGAVMSAATGSADFIDTQVWLGQWPTRRISPASTPALVAKLQLHGVTEAWAGNFDAALHADIGAANARLAVACARDGGGVLLPFGTVNPTLPDWEDEVRRCAEIHRMRGLRLLPNYHRYSLTEPRFVRLLALAAERGLLVQIAVAIEDERTQNPALAVPPTDVAGLANALDRVPTARVMLLNSFMRAGAGSAATLNRLAATRRVSHDIAALEGVAGVEKLIEASPEAQLVFGSHAPFFYFESALLKLHESVLKPAQSAALRSTNARAALADWARGPNR